MLFIYLFIYLFFYLSIYLLIYLSIYSFIHSFIHPFMCSSCLAASHNLFISKIILAVRLLSDISNIEDSCNIIGKNIFHITWGRPTWRLKIVELSMIFSAQNLRKWQPDNFTGPANATSMGTSNTCGAAAESLFSFRWQHHENCLFLDGYIPQSIGAMILYVCVCVCVCVCVRACLRACVCACVIVWPDECYLSISLEQQQ